MKGADLEIPSVAQMSEGKRHGKKKKALTLVVRPTAVTVHKCLQKLFHS